MKLETPNEQASVATGILPAVEQGFQPGEGIVIWRRPFQA